MTDDRESILKGLLKMMAHQRSAEAIGNIDEAATFARTVNRLMLKHRVTQDEIDRAAEEDDPRTSSKRFDGYDATMISEYTDPTHPIPWQALLYSIVGEANAVQAIFIADDPMQRFFLAGRDVDRAVTAALARELVRTAEKMVAASWERATLTDTNVILQFVSREEYRESWLSGFMQSIHERMKKDTAEDVADAGEMALVAISRALARTDAFIDKRFGTERGTTTREFEARSSSAAVEGFAAGERQSLETNGLEAADGNEGQKLLGTLDAMYRMITGSGS